MRRIIHITLGLLLSGLFTACTQNVKINTVHKEDYKPKPTISGFLDGIHHWNLLHKEREYQRLEDDDFTGIADNLLAYQNEDGGWPKNLDLLAVLDADSVKNELSEKYRRSTLDNRNVFPQIEYLADVYTITKEMKYRYGAEKGLDYILSAQKENGGWRGWDVDAITFNDEVTTGAADLFLKIVQGDKSFLWINPIMRNNIDAGYKKALDCILKCQILQNGVKTAWAQQHDNETFEPVKARTFELPGLTANESCPIIEFLMNINDPSPEIIESVECAVAWLESVKISGMKVDRIPLEEKDIINHMYPFDNVVVEDIEAKPIWARYYEVVDNTPFMCTRQGQKVFTLAEVNAERRTGYDWYGYWPEEIFFKYEKWKERLDK